jgi:Ca2+-binding EF-hand superfamily protein
MRTPIFALAVLSVILLTTETARSGEKGEHPRSQWREKLMEKYDTNGDGELDDQERSAMKEAWAEKRKNHKGGRRKGSWSEIRKQYDKDGDGELDDQERSAMKEAWAEKRKNRKGGRSKSRKHHHKDGDGRFHSKRHARHKGSAKKWGKHGGFDLSRHLMTRLDANKDGEISADEVPGKYHKHFKSVDADADGTVNQEEISQAVNKAKTKFVSHVQSRIFDKIDQNDDGKLDIEKIVAKVHAKLNKIDTSGDGFIDKSEFKAITSPPPAKQDASSEKLEDVQAELARLREALEKLAESLKDSK